MKTVSTLSNLLLLVTAIIWGFAFVALQMGMDYIGPFLFNGIRFALGAVSLYPVIWYLNHSQKAPRQETHVGQWQNRYGGMLLGLVLFIAATIQQIGLQYTTAGKSGFITGLYLVLVVILGLFFGHKTTLNLWIAVLLSTVGMYLLSFNSLTGISRGDILTLISTIFWAFHILLTAYLSPKTNVLKLAQTQFFVCSLLSLGVAFFTEPIIFDQIKLATIPILYGGLLSVGVAYTLQVVVQKSVHPTSAAIILSLESLFAAIGGWFFLNEILSLKSMIGCALMLAGMIFAQLKGAKA